MRWSPLSTSGRYAAALGVISAAVFLQYQVLRMSRITGLGILYPTTFLIAWYLGLRPAILSIFVGALSADYFCYFPRHSLFDRNVDVLARFALFIATASFVAWVIERGKRAEVRYRAAERRSLSSESQLRTIANRLPAFVSYMDNDRRYRFVNRAYSDWFGLAPEAIQGRTKSELVNDTATYDGMKPYEDLAYAGTAASYELTLKRADGERRSLDVEYLPDIDSTTGEIRGIIGVGHDVTARKIAQREAENAQAELVSLFMQTPIGICILQGPEHRYVLANNTYQNVLFDQPRDLIGKTVREALPEIGDGYYDLIDRVYRTGLPYEGKEVPIEIRQSDGSLQLFYLNFVYQPKRNGAGEVDGLIAIFYDLTELVQSRRKLERAVTARDEFLSIASHELKTPLSSLKLQVQLNQRQLSRGEPGSVDPEKYRQFLDRTERQVQRLDRLIEDMLDVGRIQDGRLPVEFDTFNLSDLLTEAVERMHGEAAAVDSELLTEIAPGLEIRGDRFRLEQVFVNLISNALKYAHGTSIRVTAERLADSVRVRVIDRGMGIAPENHERIFLRFERAISGQNISGMGLGLYIVRTILEQHGGRVELASELGKGSTFTVEIPINPPAKETLHGSL